MRIAALPVTVVIPTLNEADRLPACLEAVQWAAQVVVADAGSTDGTIALARRYGATVLEACGPTIAHQRNAAIAQSTQPWVLAVDADERVTPELREAIARAVATPQADAYRVHMRNQYLGAPMERGGWGRDRHVRLFKSSLRYRPQKVHEGLDYDGAVADLVGRLDHDSYRDLSHQLTKVTTYSAWGAADLHARGKRVGLSHLVARPIWRFIKCYFLQGAWREGRRGLVLSVVHAWSAFAKYALLWDTERREADALAAMHPTSLPVAANRPTRNHPVAANPAPVMTFDAANAEPLDAMEPVASRG